MELFKLYSKEKANFVLKLLFIKVSCVLNINKICSLLRTGRRTTKWVICDRPLLKASFIFLQKSHSEYPSPPKVRQEPRYRRWEGGPDNFA